MSSAWEKWGGYLLFPLVFLGLLWAGLTREHVGGHARMLLSDAEGYYVYLPATFIYKNWDAWDGRDGMLTISCCTVSADSLVKTRYTYGVALLEAPFFLAAHAMVSANQDAAVPPPGWREPNPNVQAYDILQRKYIPGDRQGATGFSDGYGIGISVAAAFYATLGLWFVRGMLRRRFAAGIANLVTGLLIGGTNLYYYAVAESGMSHVYSFCLMAAVVWLLDLWLARPRWGLSLALGGCLMLLALIRPTNVLVGVLLLGWGVHGRTELLERLRWLLRQWPQLLAMAAIGVVLLVPQLLYWHHAWGSWVVWSYEGEGFSNALHPQVLKVLFSYQNGLLLYTPLMGLALVGMGLSLWRRQHSGWAVAIIFALATYVFASWWAWWFGGAFGHRCYVEYYAVLALPLAVALEAALAHRRALMRWGTMALCLAFVVANLKMTQLYAPPWDGPDWTWDRYWWVVKAVIKVWEW